MILNPTGSDTTASIASVKSSLYKSPDSLQLQYSEKTRSYIKSKKECYRYSRKENHIIQRRNRVSSIILGEIAQILVRNPVSNPNR